MLRKIDRDIWVTEQPLQYFGLGIGTRMAVVRLANQDLAVISPFKSVMPLLDSLMNLEKWSILLSPIFITIYLPQALKPFIQKRPFGLCQGYTDLANFELEF
jgi:hypothetical protein